jgi:hypothetical protein
MRIPLQVSLAAVSLLWVSRARAEVSARAEGTLGGALEVATGEADCDADVGCKSGVAMFTPFALGAGTWGLEGTTREYDPTSFTVGIAPDLAVYFNHGTFRHRLNAHLGGGESGFKWDLGGVWMFGGRLMRGGGSPFARVGFDTWFGGNADFYHSHFEAPRFEVGYQFFRVDDVFLEVAGRGGLMLAGRHRVFDRTRDIGTSLDAGGYVTLQLSFLRLHAEAVRIFETRNEPGTPLDRGQAELCAILAHHLEVCAKGALDRGEVSSAEGGVETSASYLGLSLGFGAARIHRPPEGLAYSRSETETVEASESQK